MKSIVSLLSLLQFLGLCQIGFGIFGAGYHYASGASAMYSQFRDDRAREAVLRWHEKTVEAARSWSIATGAITLILSTGVLLSVKNLAKGKS